MLKPDPPGFSTFVILKEPVSRVIVLVTVTVTAAAWSPLVMVTPVESAPAGLKVGVVPKVHPVGALGRVGSVTTQFVPVSNGPIAELVAPAVRETVWSPAPQL